MSNSNFVGKRARYFLLLVCLISILIVGTAVATDENMQKPTKSALSKPPKPRKAGPYCGVYCLYAVMKLSGQEVDFRQLLKPEYIGSRRGSSLAELKKAAQKAERLKEKGITIAVIQTSQVTEKTLNEWKKRYNISFPVGSITADIEKTRFAWGLYVLPRLILTDKQHIVTAEGFAPAELEEKLGENSKH